MNAEDGETVLLGGLIARTSNKNENKVPWFGDLPHLGWLFRYRTQATASKLNFRRSHVNREGPSPQRQKRLGAGTRWYTR